MDKFGRLKHVELRQLWHHEALAFTPWLAQNLSLLGEALGMDLELRGSEAAVGSFSLDLLAHDLGSDRTVIIENQIETTDHDHLGKLLTYAAGHEASVAIWIAASFREEHRQALDWLNGRTDTATEFFGVVIEAIQIDDSRPAPNFRLVSSPNDWRKVNVGARSTQPSDKGEAYRAFFQNLIDLLRTRHQFTQARKAQPQSWYSFSSGIGGVAFAPAFTSQSRVRAEVYIDGFDQAWNKWLFDGLVDRREAIEAAFGEPLDWQRLDAKQASRIAIYRSGDIFSDPETLQGIETWLIERLLRLKRVIGPEVKSFLSTHTPPTVASFAPPDEP